MCPRCEPYFGEWRSHGPAFPDGQWHILSSEEFEAGTHAPVTVMRGTACCVDCGETAWFGCSYGEGYYFVKQ